MHTWDCNAMAQLKISTFLVHWYPQQDFYSETFSWFISKFSTVSSQKGCANTLHCAMGNTIMVKHPTTLLQYMLVKF